MLLIEYYMVMFHGDGHGLSLGNTFSSAGIGANINDRYSEWFKLSVDWLKKIFGDFLVYGVNDGRNSRYNIDRSLEVLFENPKVKTICFEKMPLLEKFYEDKKSRSMTPRIINSFAKSISENQLEELDEILSDM